jgi:hypothetical protein
MAKSNMLGKIILNQHSKSFKHEPKPNPVQNFTFQSFNLQHPEHSAPPMLLDTDRPAVQAADWQ